MDRAGGEVLRDVDALRAAMDRRREDRAPLLRILDRLLGFDLKLKQYAQGRVFCDTVVAPAARRACATSGPRPSWRRPRRARRTHGLAGAHRAGSCLTRSAPNCHEPVFEL